MKKKILTLALAAITIAPFSMMAQTNSHDNNGKFAPQERPAGNKDKKMRKPGPNPFEGLTLSDAQKEKLKQLGEKNRTKIMEQAKAKKENAKAKFAEKHRNDSIERATREADKKAYLKELRSILGDEQYILFLENNYINQQPKFPGKNRKMRAPRAPRKEVKRPDAPRPGMPAPAPVPFENE